MPRANIYTFIQTSSFVGKKKLHSKVARGASRKEQQHTHCLSMRQKGSHL